MSDKKPAARINLHPVSAAIWRNQTAKGTFYSVTFERSYRDESGRWQTSTNFNVNDLLLLAKLADQAHTEILSLRSKDRTADHAEEDAA